MIEQIERIEEDDEIVAGSFHMERMSDKHIWFAVGELGFDLEVVGKRLRWTCQGIHEGETWQDFLQRIVR